MISKNTIKLIRALHQKKHRTREGRFIIEGIKTIEEAWAAHATIDELYLQPEAQARLAHLPGASMVSEREMRQLTALKHPSPALAVVKHRMEELDPVLMCNERSLVLDGIRDPGNLGTILRTADWFGIDRVLMSGDTVDPFNPKCVQATMGSIFHIRMTMHDLPEAMAMIKAECHDIPCFAAALEGGDIAPLRSTSGPGMLVIGSESHGISREVFSHSQHTVTIPKRGDAESLNAAVAAAILMHEWTR